MSILLSANMSLPVPVVGIEPGPEYATDINDCLSILDSHNHAPGSGVQIDPTGLNINADLEMNSNNLIEVRTVRLEEQTAPLSEGADLGCVYQVDGDLYYNNGLGLQIQITNDSGIATSQGNIANLDPPASASYVSASDTFVWESDVNTPANMDGGSVIVRKVSANSPGVEIAAPLALASDYTMTLMAAAPGSTSFLAMDSSGNLSAAASVSQGITLAMLAQAVQQALNPAGTILATGRTSAPSGYLMCDGSSVLRASYPDLFTAIGTAFGAADGTHFNVPDLRGQFLRGVDQGTGRDPNAASRTAMSSGGNTGNNVGSIQGYEIQSHTHSLNAGSGGGIFVVNPSGSGGNYGGGGILSGDALYATATGGAETRPINAYVNFIIKT